MSSLERFTLCIRVRHRASFIDGTYLDNAVLSHMPHLVKFCFDIVTHVTISGQVNPSSDDIRRTFIERGHHVDCYIDYFKYRSDRCHVYSIPFNINRIFAITHSFPGGNFIYVRILCINDDIHSFEQEFFARISRAFPLLSRLSLDIRYERKKISEEKSSIIEYSHLTELRFCNVHIDYVEQFLSESNTRLPCLNKIYISYEDLVSVTENFTRSTTHINCPKLKHIIFNRKMAMVHSKDYYLCFPLLL